MSLRADWLIPLTAFEAAARHQNFARAAEELHLTASAVSHQVRRLEQRLGMGLFQRHARGVTLTAEGRRLADAAGSAFSDVSAALRGLRAEQRARPPLRVTTLHSFAQCWLIPRLAGFRQRHPEIRLRIETEAALTRFDDAGPDLGIRHGGGQWPGLHAQHLLDETLFAVAAPALIRQQRICSVEQVAKLPLIADLSRQGWPDWLRAAGLGHLEAIEAMVFSDSTDAFRAAADGLGAALARERIVAPWLARGDLQRLPGPVLPGRFSYFLVHPESVRLSEDAQQFIAWLLEAAREQP